MTTYLLAIALVLAIVMLFIAVYVALRCTNEMMFLREDLQQAEKTDHSKCMAAVMQFVGNEWAAQVLDIAAADYASVESQPDKDRIARLQWREDGDPIPTLWLRERAIRLRLEADWGSAIEHADSINMNEVRF